LVKEKIIPKLFLRIKPVKILTSLRKGPKYATILSKEVDCTYSHTVKLLDLFRDYGLVEFEKKGRIKIVKLTETGEEIAKGAESVLLKLSKLKEKSEK
jgi:DNA-binding MarR family transcriptional regulator